MSSDLTPDQALAVKFLEWVYAAAKKQGVAPQIAQWVDPDPPGADDNRYLRDALLAVVIERWNNFTVQQKRELYKRQLTTMMAAVEVAARKAVALLLQSQEVMIGRLQADVLGLATELCVLAQHVTRYASTQQLPVLTRDQYRYITEPGQPSGTVVTRLRRVEYLNAIRVLQGDAANQGSAPADALRIIRCLMAHPKGVEMVDAFKKSPSAGKSLATDLIQTSLKAIGSLRGILGLQRLDEKSQQARTGTVPGGSPARGEPGSRLGAAAATAEDHRPGATLAIWHFPSAIGAGLSYLRIDTNEAIVQFAMAWCRTRRAPVERALDIAGNAILVLSFLGPYGRAAAGILNIALAGAQTVVSYIKDLEQDIAADATAFASPAEQLSEGSSKFGIALLAASTIVAVLIERSTLTEFTQELRGGRSATSAASSKIEEASNVIGFDRAAGPEARGVGVASRGTTPRATSVPIDLGVGDAAVANRVNDITRAQRGLGEQSIALAAEAALDAELELAFGEGAVLRRGATQGFPVLEKLPELSADARTAAAKLLGQEFNPDLRAAWNACSNPQAVSELAEVQRLLKTGSAADREAAYELSERTYGNWRNRFWTRVRGDTSLRKIFTDAGASFDGKSGAPYFKIDGARTKNLTVTLDHFIERRVDNPARAVDALNVRPTISFENSATLEAIRRDNFLKSWASPSAFTNSNR